MVLFTMGTPIAGLPFEFRLQSDDAEHWTVDFDGDGTIDAEGTEVPEALRHTYTVAGEVVARFTASNQEGAHEIVKTYDVQWLDDEVFTASVTTTPLVQQEGWAGCVQWYTGVGPDCAVFSFDVRHGYQYRLEANGQGAVAFLNSCSVAGNALLTDASGDGEGMVPVGARCAVVWAESLQTQAVVLRLVSPSNLAAAVAP